MKMKVKFKNAEEHTLGVFNTIGSSKSFRIYYEEMRSHEIETYVTLLSEDGNFTSGVNIEDLYFADGKEGITR